MSLKPWEAGYQAPAVKTAEELHEERRANSSIGGNTRGENRKRIAKGESPQYGETTRKKLQNKGLDPDNMPADPARLQLGVRGRPDPDTPSSLRLESKVDENLSLEDLNLANRFVECYFQCWNATDAFVMAGGSVSSAATRGYEMLRWPAVRARMNAVLEQLEEEQLLTRKTVLMGLLKEAHYHGHDSSHGARIRAWMGLARIKKMDVQVTENNHTVRGGVMLIPVQQDANTIDGWGLIAEKTQTQLKEDVRK